MYLWEIQQVTSYTGPLSQLEKLPAIVEISPKPSESVYEWIQQEPHLLQEPVEETETGFHRLYKL